VDFSPEAKRLRREADHWLPSSAAVKNERSHTSSPECSFMAYIPNTFFTIQTIFFENLVVRNVNIVTLRTMYCRMWRQCDRVHFSSLCTVANRKYRLS
jgi:hypothetical protein